MAKKFRQAAAWIRRDLRWNDHAALAAAGAESDRFIVVFVFDTTILEPLQDRADKRVTFIHRSLQELGAFLQQQGSQLVVLHGNPKVEIPALAKRMQLDAVITARDYEPYARDRDAHVAAELAAVGCQFESVKDCVVREGGEVMNQSGLPFRVYTPYSKAWRAQLEPAIDLAVHDPDPSALWKADQFGQKLPSLPSLESLGFQASDPWLKPGEKAAAERLEQYLLEVDEYAEKRDFPALDKTSGMSAHLRFGTISIRELCRRAMERGTKGSDKWLAELIWRDFYQDVLWNFPEVVERPFQPQYSDLPYPGKPEHFEAWKKGQTGYPLVDAAMRCLNETGWMHNRLRMVVASFLTKDLLINFRLGEAYFAEKLLDFDLASNCGGWQWAASVGVDAQPYFRIFNPMMQSSKFDSDGIFIKQWCPELTYLDAPAIHAPWELSGLELMSFGIELGKTYPKPIVDHHTQRDLAIQLLAASK